MAQLSVSSTSLTRYELPRQGITLLGYVVRRMHKTGWLLPVAGLIETGCAAQALLSLAVYAGTASVSFGPAYYQPSFNRPGDEVSEADPSTGIVITAYLESVRPHYQIACQVELPGGGRLIVSESITGTQVRLTGLGMPAPTRFAYRHPDGYHAELAGIITSELRPGWLHGSSIRAFGEASGADSLGNRARLTVQRSGLVSAQVTAADGDTIQTAIELADGAEDQRDA